MTRADIPSNIILKVEFMTGTCIEDAIKEAKIKAGEWKVAFIEFTFNGVSVLINKNSKVVTELEKYDQRLKWNLRHSKKALTWPDGYDK